MLAVDLDPRLGARLAIPQVAATGPAGSAPAPCARLRRTPALSAPQWVAAPRGGPTPRPVGTQKILP